MRDSGRSMVKIKRNKHVMCLRGGMKEVSPPESSWLLPSIHYGMSFLSAMAVQVLPVMDLGGNKSFFSSPPPCFLSHRAWGREDWWRLISH